MDDGKDPGALRTIGEVAAAIGVRQHVLRYWEQQFPMLRPLKRSGGRRYYRREDVDLLTKIDALINQEGYTLKGARQALENGAAPSPPVSLAQDQVGIDRAPTPEALLPALRRIRARLAAALQA